MPQPGGAGAAGGTGSASAPSGMPGAEAQAMTGIKLALEALQKSMVGLRMGSDLHTAVLKAITDISKQMGKGDGPGDQSSMIQQLAQMARAQQTQGAGMPPGMPGAPPGGGQPHPPAM